jgi:hypothetical protein
MLAKLIALILGLALTGASLLVVRQQRLVAVGEMADALRRSEAAGRDLWRMRVEIADRLSPDALRAALDRTGDFEPILLEECVIVPFPRGLVMGTNPSPDDGPKQRDLGG